MADGPSDTGPATETCPTQIRDGHQRLYTSGPHSSFQDAQPQIQLKTVRGTDPADQTLANGPKQSTISAEPLSELRLHVLDAHVGNHDSVLGRHEAITMLESPAGSSQRPQTPENQTENRRRGVTYASSAAESPNRASRPPRQDSAYYWTKGVEGNGSEVGFDVQARQLRARERMLIRRERARRTRHRFRVCREKVQRLRNDVRDAIDKLTRKLNEIKALNLAISDSIDPYYEKLRLAQDELGPAEDEYDILARRLDEEEDDLEEEEDHFYRHNELFHINVPESKINASLSPSVEPSQTIDSEPTELALDDPLVRDYLEKVEEAKRLKEDVEDLENEYLQESEDATFRQRHNIPLTEETSKFLDDYQRLHAEALNDLRNAEDALFDMREQCLELGLFTESEHAYESRDALCDDVMDSVYEARDRSPIRVAAFQLRYDEKSTNFLDKKDYVNKWLLHWVEESTIEALLLRAWIYFEFPDNVDKERLGDEKWSELAVENWDVDEAGDSANKNNRESRLDTIAGITPGAAGKRHATSTGRSGVSSSLRTLDVVADEEEAMDEPLVVRSESASFTTQQAGSPITSSRQRASSASEQIPPISLYLDSTTPVVSQVQPPDAKRLRLPSKPSKPSQGNATDPYDILSTSIQSINSLATSGRKPSLQSSCTDNESLRISQDLSCDPITGAPISPQPTSNLQDPLCQVEPTSTISARTDTVNILHQITDEGRTQLPSSSLTMPDVPDHSQLSVQIDITATPKARPIADDGTGGQIAKLALDNSIIMPCSDKEEPAISEILPGSNLQDNPTYSTVQALSPSETKSDIEIPHTTRDSNAPQTIIFGLPLTPPDPHNSSTIYATKAFPIHGSERPVEAPSSRPTLEIPTITTPVDNSELQRHRPRAKSDNIFPTLTSRTRSDPIPGRPALQVSSNHRRQLSLSPTHLIAAASNVLRRVSSYGSIHNLDPDLAPS